MPREMIPSFLVYCYVGAMSPGPANLCSLSAALRYGRRAALRQWRGLLAGFTLISLLSALATWLLGPALGSHVEALSWVGAAYILWLAWHMLRSAGVQVRDDPARPSFRTGLLVQLTNVKVMIFCLAALTSFVLPYSRALPDLLAVGLFLPLTGPAANLVWLFAGASLQRLFAGHRRGVDLAMALALAACAVSLVWPR